METIFSRLKFEMISLGEIIIELQKSVLYLCDGINCKATYRAPVKLNGSTRTQPPMETIFNYLKQFSRYQ